MEHNATMRPATGGKCLVVFSTYQERQEALKRTTMMEDDVNYRSSRIFTTEAGNSSEKLFNGNDKSQTEQQINNIPPPPPQFANSPPKLNQANNNSYKTAQKTTNLSALKQPITNNTTPATTFAQEPIKPPTSPTPDYDHVQLRKPMSRPNTYSTSGARESSNGIMNNTTGNRRTMRLGTVTIGEYEQQRKEPTKFDFISAQKTNNNSNNNNNNERSKESLHAELQNTLTRSNLKKSNGFAMEHQSNCPLQNNATDNFAYKNGTNDVDNLNKKLQSVNIGNRTSGNAETLQSLRNSQTSNGTGILKNGNRQNGNGYIKSTDKSITFGNSQKF